MRDFMKLKMDYKWVALSVTTVGAFMGSVDASILVIGLPTILEDLHASIVHGIWIITGYSLMLTILLVLIGRLADFPVRPGSRCRFTHRERGGNYHRCFPQRTAWHGAGNKYDGK